MIRKNYKKILIAVPSFFMLSALPAFALDYVPVSGSGIFEKLGIQQTNIIGNLPAFLGAIFNFGIAAAVALSVIMLIWGGIEYMTTDSWTGKSDATKKFQDVAWGLGLALGAYIILYTINPCFVDFIGAKGCKNPNQLLAPPKVQATSTTVNEICTTCANINLKTNTGAQVEPCPTCVNMNPDIQCKSDTGCETIPSLRDKLIRMGLTTTFHAQITEGWQPQSTLHTSTNHCHANGTCVDLNFINSADKSDLNKIENLWAAMSSVGISGFYEQGSSCDAFKAGTNNSVPCVVYSGGSGSGHFHVFDENLVTAAPQ